MATLSECAHCGQRCGDYTGGLGGIWSKGGLVPLCHPNDPSRPDCYRRVTVWLEELGSLRGRDPLPAGVEGTSSADDAFRAMVTLTEELGLYDDDEPM